MKIPIIHQTDLFRPFNDPDDHWDLATVYSLASREEIELKGIVIDFPPEKYKTSPDIMSVNQLNYIIKKPVSVSLGSQIPFKKWQEKKSTLDKSAALFIRITLSTVNLILSYIGKLLYPRTFSFLGVPKLIMFPAVFAALTAFLQKKKNAFRQYWPLALLLGSYLLVFIVHRSMSRYLFPVSPLILIQ